MLDRSQAPSNHSLLEVSLPNIRSFYNPHGVKIHFHQTTGTGTFKLELYTKGSQLNANSAAECHLSLKMLKEGTYSKSSKQFSESVDALGSFLEITPGFDNSSIAIFGLSKYFEENVNILIQLISEPLFKESSLEKLKLKESNKLRQNLEKGSYLSSVNLRNRLFGINHPYGRVLSSEDIFALTVESVRAFHERFTNQFEIYLSGNIPDVALKCLDGFHSDDLKKPNSVKNYDPIIEDSIIRSNKFVQSSIKIGKRLFTRSHTEYYPFIVMNELLGGYFGSRLMNNIREEKGLTYGIYSHLYSLHYDGYFLISSDIKSENETEVLEEIYKEITLLQSELVSEQELETVKNYMIGTFANSLSSPFGIIEKNKVLISQNLSTEFYSNYIKNVNNINAEDITTMASKHLKIDTFTKSIVGNQKS